MIEKRRPAGESGRRFGSVASGEQFLPDDSLAEPDCRFLGNMEERNAGNREQLRGSGIWKTSVEVRYIKVSIPSSRNRANVHRTFAFDGSNLSIKTEKIQNSKSCSGFFGPSVEIRTRGLLNPIQARYQTSPHPDLVAKRLRYGSTSD